MGNDDSAISNLVQDGLADCAVELPLVYSIRLQMTVSNCRDQRISIQEIKRWIERHNDKRELTSPSVSCGLRQRHHLPVNLKVPRNGRDYGRFYAIEVGFDPS